MHEWLAPPLLSRPLSFKAVPMMVQRLEARIIRYVPRLRLRLPASMLAAAPMAKPWLSLPVLLQPSPLLSFKVELMMG